MSILRLPVLRLADTATGEDAPVRQGAVTGTAGATPTAGRARRGRAVEVGVVAAGSLALATAMTWPALRRPATTVPQDLVDPLYFVWQLAWTGHALRSDPGGMWTTNAFSGAPGNLAYTDTMIGYAPIAALGSGMDGALITYNILFVAAAALSFLGAYLLARVLGARWPAALTVAAAFSYAPWRLAHERHLNVLSTGGIALSLALIAYGHGWTLRADRSGGADGARRQRWGWVLAGWAVACWQLTLGFAVGVPFAWALVVTFGVAALVRRSRSPGRVDRRLLAANAAGGLAFAVAGAALAVPYLRVVTEFPVARRTEEMVERYSPPLHGLVTAPSESTWWGGLHAGWRESMAAVQEQALLPGFALIGLALVGVAWSAWSVRHRVLLLLVTAVTTLLALGTSAPGGGTYTYLPLFRVVPGWEALRTPGRLILWVTLCLGLLAAGAVTRAAEGLRGRGAGAGRPASLVMGLVLALPAVAVTAEGMGRVAHPVVPRSPVALADLPQPLLVLPTSQNGDFLPMTWSTDGWPELVNGGSGFEPPTQAALRREAEGFPDSRSVTLLRRRGVQTVVVTLPRGARTDPASTPATGGQVPVRRSGDALVYDLR